MTLERERFPFFFLKFSVYAENDGNKVISLDQKVNQ